MAFYKSFSSKPFSAVHLQVVAVEVSEVINHQIGPKAEIVAEDADLLEEVIDHTVDTVIPEVINRQIDL